MIYSQPQLPYDYDELQPFISQRTIECHYGLHEKTYIDNLNRLIAGTEYEEMELEEIIKTANGELFNNAAQAWNHIFYFFTFSPDGEHRPSGELLNALIRDFGGFDKFKEAFVEAGVKLFGSGWVWLSCDHQRRLYITQAADADNPLRSGLTPLLTFDVWEHAYYLDYQNRRGEALNRLWPIVDWSVVESRF
jgi:Fe-Mn family superoxide dismutase